MNQTETFEAKKAELFELIKREPEALADRDGLTPLQQRKLHNEGVRFSEFVLEEELCAEIHQDILSLNDVQLHKFVQYVLDNDFPGDCLRRRFDPVYLYKARKDNANMTAIQYALLLVLIVNVNPDYRLSPGEVLNDSWLGSIKDQEPGLWLELLYQIGDPSYYERELIDNYEARYGYGVFALGSERLVRRYGIESAERILQGVRDKLTPDELKWREDFIAEHKA